MNKKLGTALAIAFAVFGVAFSDSVEADSYGTDVSSHQGLIRYKANGFDFALVKATEGVGYVNPYLNTQTVQAEKEGILQGAYHYYRTGANGTPEQQARFFINSLGTKYANDPNTVLMLDIESNLGVDNNRFTGYEPKRFLDEVYRLTHKRALVYMNQTYANGNGGQFDWSDIKDYPLMLAVFPSMNNTVFYKEWTEQQMNKVRWFKNIPIVQYGDGNGFDRDYLYGSKKRLLSLLNKDVKGSVKPKPKPVKPQVNPATYATFKDVYVLDKWIYWGGKWYVTNRDFSIQPEDYNNWIPASAVTLTDRYGRKLRSQWGQGNNGRMEFMTISDKHKVLSRYGNAIKLQVGAEPVWLHVKYVNVK